MAAPVALPHVRPEPDHGVASGIALCVKESLFHQAWDVARGAPCLTGGGPEPLCDRTVLFGFFGQWIDLYDALDPECLEGLCKLIDPLLEFCAIGASRGFFHARGTIQDDDRHSIRITAEQRQQTACQGSCGEHHQG